MLSFPKGIYALFWPTDITLTDLPFPSLLVLRLSSGLAFPLLTQLTPAADALVCFEPLITFSPVPGSEYSVFCSCSFIPIWLRRLLPAISFLFPSLFPGGHPVLPRTSLGRKTDLRLKNMRRFLSRTLSTRVNGGLAVPTY